MKVEHIIWEDYHGADAVVSGLLDIEIHWHGGGTDRFIAEGTYTDKGRGIYQNYLLGQISEDTMGVSGVSLRRVGHLAE